MRMFLRSSLLVGCALMSVPSAHAQSPSDPEAAAQAFRAGVAAAKAQRWKEALDAFDLSYRLRPHPDTLLNLAGAQAQTGLLLEAVENYRRFESEGARTPESAPIRQAALDYAKRLEARVARLTVRIAALETDDVVELDGTPLAPAELGRSLRANPGEHRLTVERGGRLIVKREVALTESANETLELSAAAGPSTGDVAAAVGAGQGDEARAGGSLLESGWFWLGTGVVLAAAVVLTVVLVSGGSEGVDSGNLGTAKVPLQW